MRYSIEQKLDFIRYLNKDYSVAFAAETVGCSYSVACKWLRDFNLYSNGKFKDQRLTYTKELKELLTYAAAKLKNLDEISTLFGVTREQLSGIYKTAGIKIKWKLENNHNELLAASRRCELFVQNLGYKVVRDCYKCRPAGFPYDLILEGFGSIDVKSTILRHNSAGKPYASFSVENFSKGVKYAFLVVMDEYRDEFLYVFALKGKLVYGHSTISISLDPISVKYKDNLIWKPDST